MLNLIMIYSQVHRCSKNAYVMQNNVLGGYDVKDCCFPCVKHYVHRLLC